MCFELQDRNEKVFKGTTKSHVLPREKSYQKSDTVLISELCKGSSLSVILLK